MSLSFLLASIYPHFTPLGPTDTHPISFIIPIMLWADIPIKGEEPLDRNVESWDNLIRRITVYGDVIRAIKKFVFKKIITQFRK